MTEALIGFLTELLWTLRVQAYMARAILKRAARWLLRHHTPHDHAWAAHPAVATGEALTLGERAADRMKAVFATWKALGAILLFMAIWIRTGGFGHDGFPYILLNLCLSCLAALQCFILLIAARRADQIAATIALHTLQNTERQAEQLALLEQINRQQLEILTALHQPSTNS
ncbi:MAG TPA: DUF1003 domain-containing protein [Ktedonobacterales bacterium]|nr:DUF1003 domain-containing protein [Ktedonobacterales bacterium]